VKWAGETVASLVERARQGDAVAFEALVRAHIRAAHAVALAVLGSYHDTEDVVQDAFMTALDKLDDCRDPDRFAAWLLQIVRNRAKNARDYLRVRETSQLDPDHEAPADQSPATRAEQAELRDRLLEALSTLSDAQREVVLLHDLEGWQHREIAGALGCSEGMSRQHLFVARRALRERLGARGSEVSSNEQ
jgi:RNA polymerase sigma-70 factor (ECF subfamily)